MRTAYLAALLTLGLALGAQPAWGQPTPRDAAMCADCHGAAATGKQRALTHADSVSCLTCHHIGFTSDPQVAAERRMDACAGCHEELADQHVGAGEGAPACTSCHSIHEDESVEQAKGAMTSRCADCHTAPHPEHAADAEGSPECADCHTMHSGRSFERTDPSLFQACAGCHEATHPSHATVEGIFECTECHSVAEPAAGETVADVELCSTCHGTVHPAHETVEEPPACLECHDFVSDPVVAQAGVLMAERCGSCHEGAMRQMLAGGHGGFLGAEGGGDLPNCLTCHITHMDESEARDRLQISSAVQCMQCHGESSLAVRYGLPSLVKRSYVDDFHGATVQFLMAEGGTMGDKDVMICSDCHGAHDVATLGEQAVAEVCLRCHEQGEERLAGAWLGHEAASPGNRPLIWLVRLFYFVLIPFMLAGLALNIFFHLVDQRRKGARVMQTEGIQRLLGWVRGRKAAAAETVERFNRTERLEHFGSAFTFIALVVTGLPQTRPDLPIARAIIAAMGGIWSTRLIHRTIGVIFVVLMVTHVTRAVLNAVRSKRLPVMVPDRKDFEDVLLTFRHYLFREPMPRVGKFDFSEKYEYWGLFLGGIVMSSTGMILLFPELVSQLLPGIVVAATRLMHGLEATFAVMVVILWHSYGVMLRPEVFPLDTSIFTGKMSLARLKHEHPLEYDRLFPDGKSSDKDEGGD
ncbi:MAG: cytochrome b/b6 domain-containing protein [Longimicrobiales bacterium]|nr:cytochrome b/b6 domain-containing protein [Longimicrobiales bacterium]